MTYPVTQLINNAYNLSGIVSSNLQTVSGTQLQKGLVLLNALLSVKSFNTELIPYYEYTTMNLVAGQEVYFIENLVDIQTATFNLGSAPNNTRFSMNRVGRTQYFSTPRANNVNSIPYQWHLERALGGSNLYIYFIPKQVYPLQFTGKYGFLNVSLEDDLEDSFDEFYIEYLRYALAQYICSDYGVTFQPDQKMVLQQYEYQLKYVSPIDFSTNVRSFANKRTGDPYAQANVGKGYTT